MMHQNGHRYRLVQADPPMLNKLVSDAGAVTSSVWLLVTRSSNGVLRKDFATILPKHQNTKNILTVTLKGARLVQS